MSCLHVEAREDHVEAMEDHVEAREDTGSWSSPHLFTSVWVTSVWSPEESLREHPQEPYTSFGIGSPTGLDPAIRRDWLASESAVTSVGITSVLPCPS